LRKDFKKYNLTIFVYNVKKYTVKGRERKKGERKGQKKHEVAIFEVKQYKLQDTCSRGCHI